MKRPSWRMIRKVLEAECSRHWDLGVHFTPGGISYVVGDYGPIYSGEKAAADGREKSMRCLSGLRSVAPKAAEAMAKIRGDRLFEDANIAFWKARAEASGVPFELEAAE